MQQIDDPVLVDLILEQDLHGLLIEPIKLIMQKNNFEGRSVLISSLLFGFSASALYNAFS